MTHSDETPLDNPGWVALTGRHASLGARLGDAARYHPEVSVLAGLRHTSADALRDMASLVEPEGIVALGGIAEIARDSPDWVVLTVIRLLQMVGSATDVPPREPVQELGTADAQEMLELAELTRPGPFAIRTHEMGRYVGVRDAGRLIAMSGERMAPGSWTEVSGVCTHPDARGRGLALRLVGETIAGIVERGERPFLHVVPESPSFETAVALYERLGFRRRREVELAILRRLP